MSSEVRVIGIDGIPEAREGDDPARLVLDGLEHDGVRLEDGDVVVVTHKFVSKAEGRLVDLRTIEPSPFARQLAERYEKDARQVEVVLRESTRIVRMDHGVIIAETPHGFVCANAAVDASNAPGAEIVVLLPVDPDDSARRIRDSLMRQTGVDVAVIITDSFGRPWRSGIVDVAIGVAGMVPLVDYRGQHDDQGYELRATVVAIADEIASAAELATGKLDRRPVAIVRGYHYERGEGSGQDLVRDPSRDMFR
jgi:coenzyme F420-0:L-glutamate ligase / coenzyme F420-1:gamma-L-glutamate ligase